MSEEKKPVALYDMQIAALGLRQKSRLEFASIKEAANFLGYEPNKLGTIIKNKQYAYHRETKQKYAPRLLKN